MDENDRPAVSATANPPSQCEVYNEIRLSSLCMKTGANYPLKSTETNFLRSGTKDRDFITPFDLKLKFFKFGSHPD